MKIDEALLTQQEFQLRLLKVLNDIAEGIIKIEEAIRDTSKGR